MVAAAMLAGTRAVPHGSIRAGTPEGCYDVRVGLWLAVTDQAVSAPRLPPERVADSTAFVLPPRIRLSDRPLSTPVGEGWKSAAAPEGALPTGHRYQAWRPAADGGVLLWFAAARHGLEARLEAADAGFRGQVRTFDADGGAQLYERELALAPVDCASAPPISTDALRPLPRAVELVGGARLALGAPAPGELRTVPRPTGALGVATRSAGLFAGSDSVAYRVGANDGNVGVVQLVFPAPADADTLIDRITRAFGPPDPNTAVPGGWWHNRVTEVSVIPDTAGGFRVLLQDPRSW